jgi:hypothetical protein
VLNRWNDWNGWNDWNKTLITMSVYQLNKLLYLTDNDANYRKRIKENPQEAIKDFRLTQEEVDALTSGAVGKLYQMGVHTFLLNHLYRYELFGVNRDNYLTRIREGMEYDARFEQGNMPVQRFLKQ